MTTLWVVLALAISVFFGAWFFLIAKRRGDDRFAYAMMGFLIGPFAFLLLPSEPRSTASRSSTNHSGPASESR